MMTNTERRTMVKGGFSGAIYGLILGIVICVAAGPLSIPFFVGLGLICGGGLLIGLAFARIGVGLQRWCNRSMARDCEVMHPHSKVEVSQKQNGRDKSLDNMHLASATAAPVSKTVVQPIPSKKPWPLINMLRLDTPYEPATESAVVSARKRSR